MTETKEAGPRALLGKVFVPATWALNRMGYGLKFLLIGFIFLVPFAYVSFLQYQGSTRDVEFNQAEHDGVVYVAPVQNLLYAIQRHRLFAAAIAAGDGQARAKLDEATADAARWEKEVDAVDGRLGGELQTTARWREAKAAWAAARDGKFASASDADRAHDDALAALADLIVNYAGNKSNLILDPDLDSYWLMDALLIKLPALGNTVSKVTSRALLSATGDPELGFDVAGLNKLVEVTAGDLKSVNFATAVKETKNFGQSKTLPGLLAPLEELGLALGSHRQAVVREYLGAMPTRDGRAFAETTERALAQLNAFAGAIGPELDALIVRRVDNYQRDRRGALIAAAIAGLLLTYLFIGFFLAIRTSIAAIGDAARRMIAGTTETFALATRDELARVASDYNQINAALVESRTLQAQVQRDNDELQANIMQLLSSVSDASDGDLTVRAPITTGALGNVADAFNQLMESLQALIGDVQRQVDQTKLAIGKINDASQEMTAGASAQAREVVAATELAQRMAAEMLAVSKNAVAAAEAARRTEASAVEGETAVGDVVGGMETLRQNVQAGAKKMKGLGDRSMEITSIVSTINRISEQTNMLALNAAIEAARAGEHGRGFSVVAEEVRKLAERTAAATTEIEKLVKAIHVETNETVNAIEQQTQVVEQESQVVSGAGVSLRKIREESAQSAELVAAITNVADAQAAQTGQVVLAMTQISAIASATQVGAQGTATTAGQLLALSSKLSEVVGKFRVAAS